METTTNPVTVHRTALRGKAFDQYNRGLLTNAELQSQLLLIAAGSYDNGASR